MNTRHQPIAPAFRSAHVVAGPKEGPLPRRLLGRMLSISIALHLGAGVSLVAMSLMTLESVPPPPIVVTFLAPTPPPPPLVPLREKETEPPPLPPPPKPKPPAKTITQPEVPPPVILRPAEPRRRPEPPPLRVETAPEPIRIAEVMPEVRIRDSAPPAPRAPSVGRVDASASPLSGGGAEPEIAFLVPGEARQPGHGGELAGRGDGLPPLRGVDDGETIRRQGGDSPGGSGIATEGSFGGNGDASFLGRKYGVTLVEARRLGQRTSDGSRYALLLPMLSEACRGLDFVGRRRGAAGGTVESVQVDEREIAIRYRDGTLHVLVPTADGLVALYVSADRQSTANLSKVDEAERALGVLRRFMQAGSKG